MATSASNGSFRRNLARNFVREGARFSNNKSARSADIHDIMGAQFPCEHTRAKGPAPSNIDSSDEDNQSHGHGRSGDNRGGPAEMNMTRYRGPGPSMRSQNPIAKSTLLPYVPCQ
jgi:hypothetical protein